MAHRPPGLGRVLETALYHSTEEREAVRSFYQDVLGLRLVSQWERGAAYRLGDGVVLIFDRDQTLTQRLPHGSSGSGHVCFVVPPDEYERWKERAAQMNVGLIEEVDSDGVRSLYFKDPAGNLLEIADGDMWPP